MSATKNIIFLILILVFIDGHSMNEVLIKADSINDLAWEKMDSNPELSMKLADDIYKIYSSINYTRGLIKTFYLKGYINQSQFYYDLAARDYFAGLELVKNYSGENSALYEMLLLQNLGNIYEYTFNYNMALQYYQKALSIASQENLESDMSVLNYNIAVIHEKMQSYKSAELFYFQAIDVTNPSNYALLGTIYNSIGNVYNKTKQFGEAKSYYLKAIEYQKKVSNKENLAYYISNLGENLFKQDKIDESIVYYKEALSLALNLEDYIKAKALHNDLGDAYFAQKNYRKAIEQFEKSIALANPEVLDPEYQRASENISQAYKEIGEYQKALTYQDNVIAQSNILEETREKLLEQNSQYRMKEVEWMLEKQAKEAKLSYIQAENFWFKVSMTLLFLILIGASYKAYRYYRGIRLVKKWLAAEV